MVLSFVSRSSVAISIRNLVADKRQRQNNLNGIPKSSKKKRRKDVGDEKLSAGSVTVLDVETSAFAEEDIKFKPSILNTTDEDDYGGNST